jgi:uncharacterized membrane protein
MPDRANVLSTVQGLVGGLVGGALGFLAFRWAYYQSFYAMILPGALAASFDNPRDRLRRGRPVARALHGMAVLSV